jgi:hypothetical protein
MKVFKKNVELILVHRIQHAYNRVCRGSCKHSNKPSGSIKDEELTAQLSDNELLNHSASWRYMDE